MNPFANATILGYGTNEILDFMKNFSPKMAEKIQKALALGYSAEEVMDFIGNGFDTASTGKKKSGPTYESAMRIMGERNPEAIKQSRALREQRDQDVLTDTLTSAGAGAVGAGIGALAGGPMGAVAGGVGGATGMNDLMKKYEEHVQTGGSMSLMDWLKSIMKGGAAGAAASQAPKLLAALQAAGQGGQEQPAESVEEVQEEIATPAPQAPTPDVGPQESFEILNKKGAGNVFESIAKQVDSPGQMMLALEKLYGKKFLKDIETEHNRPAREVVEQAWEFVKAKTGTEREQTGITTESEGIAPVPVGKASESAGIPTESDVEAAALTELGQAPGVQAQDVKFKSVSDDPERWKFSTEKFEKAKEGFEKVSSLGEIALWHRPQSKHKSGMGEIRALDKDGNVIGSLTYDDTSKGKIEAAVEVDPNHRRKGIASKMYEEAERLSGKTLKPAEEQTPYSKALWDKKDRSFGKEEKEDVKPLYKGTGHPELQKYIASIGKIDTGPKKDLSKSAKELQALKSSNVRYADYDEKEQKLQVLFAGHGGKSGQIYEYFDVPREDVEAMMKGSGTAVTTGANSFRAWFGGKNPSIGRAFGDFIKKKDENGDAVYPYRQISEKYVKDDDLLKVRGADKIHATTRYVEAFDDLVLKSQAKTRAEGLKMVSETLKELPDDLLETMIFEVTKNVGKEVKEAKSMGKQKRYKGGREGEIKKRVEAKAAAVKKRKPGGG